MGRARRLTAGERLEARLRELGLSRTDLCARLKISSSALSRWISGERLPSLELAFRLEKELGFPAESWLVTPRTGTDG